MGLLAVGIALLPWVTTRPASAIDTIPYSFAAPVGERPSGRLVADSSGALFGVTYRGGADPSGPLMTGPAYDHLHHLVLYGVTAAGGAHDKGAIYSVHP